MDTVVKKHITHCKDVAHWCFVFLDNGVNRVYQTLTHNTRQYDLIIVSFCLVMESVDNKTIIEYRQRLKGKDETSFLPSAGFMIASWRTVATLPATPVKTQTHLVKPKSMMDISLIEVGLCVLRTPLVCTNISQIACLDFSMFGIWLYPCHCKQDMALKWLILTTILQAMLLILVRK